jgi:soluble lytic murein transglycosylase-like protein
LAGLPVNLCLGLLLTLLPPAWEEYARAREGEGADPAAAAAAYRSLRDADADADADVAALAAYRLMAVEPAEAARHFQALAGRGPTQELLEAGLERLIETGNPEAAALFARYRDRTSQAFRRKAEKQLVEARFLAGAQERKRLVREVLEGRSAFKKARLARLCLDHGEPLGDAQWEVLFQACLEARELKTAEEVLAKFKLPLPPGRSYYAGRLRFLQRDYAAAIPFFEASRGREEAAEYQVARCRLAMGEWAAAREAFGGVKGKLAPLARYGIVRIQLIEGDLEGALRTARTLGPGRIRRDALLACAIAQTFAGGQAKALRILQELKGDGEVAYWRARLSGDVRLDLTPKSSPFNALHLNPSPLPNPPILEPTAERAPPTTFPRFLLARGLWEDAWLLGRKLPLGDRERAALAQRVGEYRKEMNLAYPEASRMLAGPVQGWDPAVLAHFFPRAFEAQVLKASARHGVPPEVIWSVMRQESTYNPDALSPAGAMGLMQLIPPTYGEYANGAGTVWQAEENILSGAKYLAKLHAQFGNWICAVAAYNAGEDAVAIWMKIPASMDLPAFYSLIPYAETKGYVRSVLYNMMLYRMLYADLRPAPASGAAP